METKHTPGPWRVFKGASTEGECGDLTGISFEVWYKRSNQREEAEANAKLISAAPDLLEACMNLENDDNSIPKHAWDMLQEAIKKATP